MSELLLPKNLKYGSKIESAPCKSYRTNIAPQNGTAYGSTTSTACGTTIIINIPTRKNLVMVPSESYLKFTHSLANTHATIALDVRWPPNGAHNLIQKIAVYHGSNLLSSIDSYGMLTKLLMDIQTNTPTNYGKNNVMCGTRADTFNVAATGANLNINSGEIVATQLAAVNGVSAPQTYCLNLVSLIGSLCQQQYLPLFALDSAPLRVEITIADSINKIYNCFTLAGNSVGNVILSNVEFIANFIELGDSAMNMVYESLQGKPLQFVVPDYRNYQYSFAIPVTQTQVNIPIASKFSSLKALFVCQRDKYNTDRYDPTSSVCMGLTDYQFRIGSQLYPSKAVNTYTEMFCECLKAIGSMGDLNSSPSIDLYSYTLQQSNVSTVANILAGSSSSGSFYIAIDLENYASSDKSSIFTGFNTLTDDCYCIVNYGSGTVTAATTNPTSNGIINTGANAMRYDVFANFDTLLVFENSTAFARY